MEINEIVEVYPQRWMVLAPQQRDERNFVSLWEVLDEAKTLEEGKILQKTYNDVQFSGVVLYNTEEPEDGSEAAIVAEFFRVYYGMNL